MFILKLALGSIILVFGGMIIVCAYHLLEPFFMFLVDSIESILRVNRSIAVLIIVILFILFLVMAYFVGNSLIISE